MERSKRLYQLRRGQANREGKSQKSVTSWSLVLYRGIWTHGRFTCQGVAGDSQCQITSTPATSTSSLPPPRLLLPPGPSPHTQATLITAAGPPAWGSRRPLRRPPSLLGSPPCTLGIKPSTSQMPQGSATCVLSAARTTVCVAGCGSYFCSPNTPSAQPWGQRLAHQKGVSQLQEPALPLSRSCFKGS